MGSTAAFLLLYTKTDSPWGLFYTAHSESENIREAQCRAHTRAQTLTSLFKSVYVYTTATLLLSHEKLHNNTTFSPIQSHAHIGQNQIFVHTNFYENFRLLHALTFNSSHTNNINFMKNSFNKNIFVQFVCFFFFCVIFVFYLCLPPTAQIYQVVYQGFCLCKY